MKPNSAFLKLPKQFWANVRLISQEVGYTERGKKQIKIPTTGEIRLKLQKIDIDFDAIIAQQTASGSFGKLLEDYFAYRADILNSYVEVHLMNVEKAKYEFDNHFQRRKPTCPIPQNKQKGTMKAPAYLTGLVNMLIEENLHGMPVDYDPNRLTIVTKDGLPVRTLARRVDGAFPSCVNPIAIWEIKEYYYTTTFGSRIADGIYETLLDGMEVEELLEHEKVEIKHYLMVDAYETWWKQGKSYLCRIIDMLHMGYIDEVLFGYEVVERLPEIVIEWGKLFLDRKEKLGQSIS